MTGAVDLMRELIESQADFGTDHLLTRWGVPASVTPIAGLLRIDHNVQWWSPDPDGEPFIIIPAFDGGELVDLIAFQPHRPTNWKIRVGAVPMLGLDNIATNFGQLYLWRDPLNYMRARLEGVVVLAWPEARPLLACAREIVAEDVRHGRELQSALSRQPALPKISVPRSAVSR